MAATETILSVLPKALELPETQNVDAIKQDSLVYAEKEIYQGQPSAKHQKDNVGPYNQQIGEILNFAKTKVLPLYFSARQELEDNIGRITFFHEAYNEGKLNKQSSFILDEFKRSLEIIFYMAFTEAQQDIENKKTDYLSKRKSDLHSLCLLFAECGPGNIAVVSATVTSWLLVNSASTNLKEILLGLRETLRIQAVQDYCREHNISGGLNSHIENPIKKISEQLGLTVPVTVQAQDETETQVTDEYTQKSQITDEMIHWYREYINKHYNRTGIIDYITQHFWGLLIDLDKDAPDFLEKTREKLAAFYQLKSIGFSDENVIDRTTQTLRKDLRRTLRFFCEKLLIEQGFIYPLPPCKIKLCTGDDGIFVALSAVNDGKSLEVEKLTETLQRRLSAISVSAERVIDGVKLTLELINGAPETELQNFVNLLTTLDVKNNFQKSTSPSKLKLNYLITSSLKTALPVLIQATRNTSFPNKTGIIEDLSTDSNKLDIGPVLDLEQAKELVAFIKNDKLQIVLPNWNYYYALLTLLNLPMEYELTVDEAILSSLNELGVFTEKQFELLQREINKPKPKPLSLAVDFALHNVTLTLSIINFGKTKHLSQLVKSLKEKFEKQGFDLSIEKRNDQWIIRVLSNEILQNLKQVGEFVSQHHVNLADLNNFRLPIEAELTGTAVNDDADDPSQAASSSTTEDKDSRPLIKIQHTTLGFQISFQYKADNQKYAKAFEENLQQLISGKADIKKTERKAPSKQGVVTLMTLSVSYQDKKNILLALMKSKALNFTMRATDFATLSNTLIINRLLSFEELEKVQEKFVEPVRGEIPYYCLDRNDILELLSLDEVPDIALVYCDGLPIQQWALINNDYGILIKLLEKKIFSQETPTDEFKKILSMAVEQGDEHGFLLALNYSSNISTVDLDKILVLTFNNPVSEKLSTEVKLNLIVSLLNKGATLANAGIHVDDFFTDIIGIANKDSDLVLSNSKELPVLTLEKIITNIMRTCADDEMANKLRTPEVTSLMMSFYQRKLRQLLSEDHIHQASELLLSCYNRKNIMLFQQTLVINLLITLKEDITITLYNKLLLQATVMLAPLAWQQKDFILLSFLQLLLSEIPQSLQPVAARSTDTIVNVNNRDQKLATTLYHWLSDAIKHIEDEQSFDTSTQAASSRESSIPKGKGKAKSIGIINNTGATNKYHGNANDNIRQHPETLLRNMMRHVKFSDNSKNIQRTLEEIINCMSAHLNQQSTENLLLELIERCQKIKNENIKTLVFEPNVEQLLSKLIIAAAIKLIDPEKTVIHNQSHPPLLLDYFILSVAQLCRSLTEHGLMISQKLPSNVAEVHSIFHRNNAETYPLFFQMLSHQLHYFSIMEAPLEPWLTQQITNYQSQIKALAKLSHVAGIPYCEIPGKQMTEENLRREKISDGLTQLLGISDEAFKQSRELLIERQQEYLSPIPLVEVCDYFNVCAEVKLCDEYWQKIEELRRGVHPLINNYDRVMTHFSLDSRISSSREKRRNLRAKYQHLHDVFLDIKNIFENNENHARQIVSEKYPFLTLNENDHFTQLKSAVEMYTSGYKEQLNKEFNELKSFLVKTNQADAKNKFTYADYLVAKEAQGYLRKIYNKSGTFYRGHFNLTQDELLFTMTKKPYGQIVFKESGITFYTTITEDFITELREASNNYKSPDPFAFNSVVPLLKNTAIKSESIAASSSNNFPNHLANLYVDGNDHSGSSSLILRFADDTFTESFISTIDVDFKRRDVPVAANESIRLLVWDKKNKERFREIIGGNNHTVSGIIITVDVTQKDFLNDLNKHLTKVKNFTAAPFIIIALTKCDLYESQPEANLIDLAEIEKFAEKNQIPLVATSAKTGQGVQYLFELLGQIIYQKRVNISSEKNNMKIGSTKQKTSKSCVVM